MTWRVASDENTQRRNDAGCAIKKTFFHELYNSRASRL